MTGEDWRADALCAQVGGDFWFPEPGEVGRAARKVCAACPVIDACLDYSIRTNQTDGIWGGLGVKARNRLRRRTA